jgi:hypothetical protein
LFQFISKEDSPVFEHRLQNRITKLEPAAINVVKFVIAKRISLKFTDTLEAASIIVAII